MARLLKTTVRILRADGRVQRYHSTPKRQHERGREWDRSKKAWVHVKPKVGKTYEVALYTFSSDGQGHEKGEWRYELRMCIVADDEKQAVQLARERCYRNLPSGYLDFFDAVGLFTDNVGVAEIPEADAYKGIRYHKFHGGAGGEIRNFDA